MLRATVFYSLRIVATLLENARKLLKFHTVIYCFGVDIRLLFLVSMARITDMLVSVERQGIAN